MSRRPAPLALSVEEAAGLLGVSTSTIYTVVRQGHLPKVPHMGKSVRIPTIALERFAAGLPPATDEEMRQLVEARHLGSVRQGL